MTTAILAARPGAFPAAEGLETRPCTRRGALRAIRVGYASLDFVKEPVCFLERAVEAGCKSVVHIVRDLHGFVHVLDPADGRDRQEHLVLPQAMRERQISDECGLAE